MNGLVRDLQIQQCSVPRAASYSLAMSCFLTPMPTKESTMSLFWGVFCCCLFVCFFVCLFFVLFLVFLFFCGFFFLGGGVFF